MWKKRSGWGGLLCWTRRWRNRRRSRRRNRRRRRWKGRRGTTLSLSISRSNQPSTNYQHGGEKKNNKEEDESKIIARALVRVVGLLGLMWGRIPREDKKQDLLQVTINITFSES